jgi:diaminopimelate epimerase
MVVPINFIKMHGLGNDFVIVYEDDCKGIDMRALAVQISDRRTGIGCDQFIIIRRTDLIPAVDELLNTGDDDKITDRIQFEMLIYNQDGSPAKMCGNAARCVTKLISEEINKSKFHLMVSDRILECFVQENNLYSVNMSHPDFASPWMLTEEKLWNLAGEIGINSRDIMQVDMGNPHLIIIEQNISNRDKYLLGSKLEKHALFPDGVNVDFVSIKNNEIDLEVWERGAGLTLACGSGACASFAAALKLGFVEDKAIVNFKLGKLFLENSPEGIILTGPVSLVCKGIYELCE